MKYLIYLLLSVSAIATQGQTTPNYIEYYELINKAETCMFLNNHYDSAKRYYSTAFEKFDFCFVKDCFTAAEMAAFYNDKEGFKKFILKAFENGYKLQYLGKTPAYFSYPVVRVEVFDEFLKDRQLMAYLAAQYPAGHAKYLARINKTLRVFMQELFIKDQVSKNNRGRDIPGHPEYKFSENKFVATYKSVIDRVGFPLEKIVGLMDSSMVELGEPQNDLLYMFDHKIGNLADSFHTERGEFVYEEPNFAADFCYYPLLHNSCSYNDYQYCYEKQIALGNIHPREVAFLSEFFVGKAREDHECTYPYFSYGNGRTPLGNESISTINSNRAKLHIVPLEVDLAKKKFVKEHHVKLFYGSFDFM